MLCSKRSNAVAAKSARVVQPKVSVVMGKMTDVSSLEKKEVLWMRDPKTGNWAPENHFNQIDVAELRDKLLPKKNGA